MPNDAQKKILAFKGILLDLDNTLYAYKPCHEYALKKCHQFFSANIQKISLKKFCALYAKGRKAVKKNNSATVGSRSRHLYFQRVLEIANRKTDVRNSLMLGDIYWKFFIQKMKRRPWVLPFLKHAKKRSVTIAIVTNLESSLQYKKLLRLGVEQYIDFVVTSEEAGVEKPNPKIFNLALKKMRLKPRGVILIGDDALVDGRGAKHMGISFYVVH